MCKASLHTYMAYVNTVLHILVGIILPVLTVGFEQNAYTFYESRQEPAPQICVSVSTESPEIDAVLEVTVTPDTAQGTIMIMDSGSGLDLGWVCMYPVCGFRQEYYSPHPHFAILYYSWIAEHFFQPAESNYMCYIY